jgi:hypothetical protein
MSELTEFWLDSYRRKRGASYKGFGVADAVTLNRLSKIYGERDLRWMIGQYLEIEDDALVRNRGWDTGGLSMRARSLYLERVRRYGETEVAQSKAKAAEVTSVKDPRALSLLDRLTERRR